MPRSAERNAAEYPPGPDPSTTISHSTSALPLYWAAAGAEADGARAGAGALAAGARPGFRPGPSRPLRGCRGLSRRTRGRLDLDDHGAFGHLVTDRHHHLLD